MLGIVATSRLVQGEQGGDFGLVSRDQLRNKNKKQRADGHGYYHLKDSLWFWAHRHAHGMTSVLQRAVAYAIVSSTAGSMDRAVVRLP